MGEKLISVFQSFRDVCVAYFFKVIFVKLAANLSLLWQELPFLDRFDAAAAAGFPAVEVLFPYDISVRDMQMALRRNGLRMILMNGPPPNYAGGPRGFAAIPGGRDRFRHDMKRSFRYAETLGVQFLHVMAGNSNGPDAFDAMVENLRWASRNAPKGLTLTIGPFSKADMPGYFLSDYRMTARILDAVRKPNVRLQYDSYQADMIHGDAVEIWRRFGLRAAHVQLGDSPGPVAPFEGTIDFAMLFREIENSGYQGWISAHYKPGQRATEESLRWIKKLKFAA